MPNLLLVSGSLRAESSNGRLLAALGRMAPTDVVVTTYTKLGELPQFNPDIEGTPDEPRAVLDWRAALARADAVIVSSPEYAHGIPGSLKNALDWIVGSGELVMKPVGVLSGSSASLFAHPQLVEVLTVMNAEVIAGATRIIDVPRVGASVETMVADPAIASALRDVHEAIWRKST